MLIRFEDAQEVFPIVGVIGDEIQFAKNDLLLRFFIPDDVDGIDANLFWSFQNLKAVLPLNWKRKKEYAANKK